MVLRCSLLGHDYGAAEVEHEREERGSEVVHTVVEFEECSRCGDRNVISENTEVTTLEPDPTADAPVPDEEQTGGPPGDEPGDAAEVIDDAGADDAELLDEATDAGDAPATGAGGPATATAGAEPAGDGTADADAGSETAGSAGGTAAEADAGDAPGSDHPAVDDPEADVPTDDDGEPIVDDAEILEDESETRSERDRRRGEWPESDDVGPPESGAGSSTAWPEAAGDAAASVEGATDRGGVVTEPADGDDAAIVDADPAGSGDHPAASSPDGGAGSGIASARSAPTPGESAPPEDVPTEFFCPRCDFVAAGDRGSLRPGDICPDCRKGYLSERER